MLLVQIFNAVVLGAYAPRKTLVLELENKFIRIEDAEFNIIPSENRNLEKNKLFLGVSLFFIKGITFKGM